MGAPAGEWTGFVAVVVTVAYVYGQTMFQTIPGGDSGELVAEACHLGVAHPPGYPLLTLMLHAVISLAPSRAVYSGKYLSPAFWANSFSVCLGSLAAGFLYSAILNMLPDEMDPPQLSTGGRRGQRKKEIVAIRSSLLKVGCSLFASISFALSPRVWAYTIGIEVFSLNNLFTCWLLREFVLITKTSTSTLPHGRLLGSALLCGLSMSNQHTIVLFQIPMILIIFFQFWKNVKVHHYIQYGLVFLVGLAPYSYLYLVQNINRKPGSWGNTASLGGLIHHILRRGTWVYLKGVIVVLTHVNILYFESAYTDYGTFQLYSGETENAPLFSEKILAYIEDLYSSQLSTVSTIFICIAIIFGLVGTIQSWGKAKGHSSLARMIYRLLLVWLFYIGVFHALSNLPLHEKLLHEVHSRFWQQPNTVPFMILGCSSYCVAGYMMKYLQPQSAQKLFPSVLIVGLLSHVIAVTYSLLPVQSQVHNSFIKDYGKAILSQLPIGATLLVSYDMQWTAVRYLSVCEEFRQDVSLIDAPMLSFEWFSSYRDTYPNVTFPGTHLTAKNTLPYANGAFSWIEFMETNVPLNRPFSNNLTSQELPSQEVITKLGKQNPLWMSEIPQAGRHNKISFRKAVHSGLFFVGKGTGKEFGDFVMIPYGMGSIAVRQSYIQDHQNHLSVTLRGANALQAILDTYSPPINVTPQTGPQTWEYASRTEFWLTVKNSAIYGLQLVTKFEQITEAKQSKILLFSLARLEEYLNECAKSGEAPDDSTFKNLGVGYARLVKSNIKMPTDVKWPIPYTLSEKGLIQKLQLRTDEQTLKDVASIRVLKVWEQYLTTKSAKTDPASEKIATVVESLRRAGRR